VETNPGPPKPRRQRGFKNDKAAELQNGLIEAMDRVAAERAVLLEKERAFNQKAADDKKRSAIEQQALLRQHIERKTENFESVFPVDHKEVSRKLWDISTKWHRWWNMAHGVASHLAKGVAIGGAVSAVRLGALGINPVPQLVTAGALWVASRIFFEHIWVPWTIKLKCRVSRAVSEPDQPYTDLRSEYNSVVPTKLEPYMFNAHISFEVVFKKKRTWFSDRRKEWLVVTDSIEPVSAEIIAQLLSPDVVSHNLTKEETYDRMSFKVKTLHPVNYDRFNALEGKHVALSSVKVAYALYREYFHSTERMHNFLTPRQLQANESSAMDTDQMRSPLVLSRRLNDL